VSTTDHPASYYQHEDITDPTPYEDEPNQWGDLECPFCERPICHGEDVIIFNHDDLVRTIAMHKDCFCVRLKKGERLDLWTVIQRFMESLGFEIEEGDVL
jgi:hypothetical protein